VYTEEPISVTLEELEASATPSSWFNLRVDLLLSRSKATSLFLPFFFSHNRSKNILIATLTLPTQINNIMG
jgi:hypothetical protein